MDVRERVTLILNKAREGERVSPEEALCLVESAPLTELGAAANVVRQRWNPQGTVTYLIDRNINYTNVCNTDCHFCAFYRHDPKHPESYVLPKEVIAKKIEEALALGATRILLQGGHNDELPYSYYLDLISWMHANFPIEINAFSPSEIHQMHRVSGKSYAEILGELYECGMRGLPGGGAEILDDEVRQRVSPKKISADTWLEIMGVAHAVGLTTTATMVIGLGESIQHRVNHLRRVRELQDRSRTAGYEGFNAFISWTLQANERTSLGRSRHAADYGATIAEYLRNAAVGRIFLDNIQHHQASWPTVGAESAALALEFGCDDFGSTMMEENVVSQAGGASSAQWSMSPEELREHIQRAGYAPRQRTTSFAIMG